VVHKNAPHRLCGHSVKVPAVLPCDAVVPSKSQEDLVNEGGGLQRVIRSFVAQVSGGALSQFVIDEGNERIASFEVAARPGSEQLAHVTDVIAHDRSDASS
jgi:hypothetical protein